MSQENVLTIVTSAIWTVIVTAAPPLILGLTVGVLVSLIQTITSIQEQTLAFVPKILAVFLSLVFFGPWMLNNLQQLFLQLLQSIPMYLG